MRRQVQFRVRHKTQTHNTKTNRRRRKDKPTQRHINVRNVRLRFQFYEQFDDDEIGALDNAELEGFIEPDSARLQEIIKDYFIQKEKE